MKNENSILKQFHNDEFGNLNVLVIDGNPYFPAVDCAKTLGYNTPRHAVSRHCKEGMKRAVPTNGGIQEKIYIPEGDLYRLILRSKLPAAVRFESWVFSTVLPSIRKFGAYVTPETLDEMNASPEFTASLIEELRKERDKNAALVPKAKYYDQILQCKKAIPVSLIAKDYGMSAAAFNNMLYDFGIQYRIAGTWLLYQKYAGMGYTQTKTYHYGENGAAMHTCWTQRGRLFLYETLLSLGITPITEFISELETYVQMTLDSVKAET